MFDTKMPFYKSLSGRLLAAFAAVVVVSVGGLGVADYVNERDAIEAQVQDQLVSIADLKKEQILTWLDERQADARLLAVNKLNQDHLTAILSPDSAPARKLEFAAFLTDNLIGLQRSRIGYSDIVLVDKEGVVAVATDPSLVDRPVVHDVVFAETLKSSSGTFIQDIHFDPNTGLTKMAFGHTIQAIDLDTGLELPSIIGVVIITVDMNETIYPLIRAWPGMGTTGETLLVRAEGDTTLFLNNLRFDNDAALNLRIPAESPDAKPAHLSSRGSEGIIQTPDYRGMPVLAAYRHIPAINWGFVAKEDLNEAFAPVDALARWTIWIALVVLLGAGVISLHLSRTLTRPLAELVEGTRAVAAGDLTSEIDITRSDEIGALADSFRVMVASLEQRQQEVEAANEAIRRSAEELKITSKILDSLNATPDVTKAFPDIVAGLRAILTFETASLALLDADREQIYFVVMDQPRVVPNAGHWTPITDTAAAEDLLAGRPHLTPYLKHEVDFSLERTLYEAGYRSRISLPLRIEGESIGMLNMGWLIPNGYSSAQLKVLEQIVDAIALAVERSRLFDETRQRSTELTTLNELSLAINSSLETAEVLQLAIDHTVHLLDVVGAGIFLVGDDGLLYTGTTSDLDPPGDDKERLAIVNRIWQGFSTSNESFKLIPISDLPVTSTRVGEPLGQGVKSFNVIRLAHGGEVLGMLGVLLPRSNVTATEKQLVQTIAQIISPAISHAQHYSLTHQQLQQTNQRLTLVNRISRRLSAILDDDQLLSEVMQLVQDGLEYDYVGVGIVDGSRVAMRTTAVGQTGELPVISQEINDQSLTNWVINNAEALLIADVDQDSRYQQHPGTSHIKSELLVPIRLADHILGVLLVASDQPAAFTEDDQTLLQAIADQLALALHNAQSYGQLREMAIQTLQESEERLRNIYEAANDAIFLIDPESNYIIEGNPKASEMLGYEQEELAGMPVSQIHPGEMALIDQLWQETLTQGVGQSDQLTCLTQNGEIVPAEASFSEVRIRNERYILAMVRDVTQRKELEEQLRQSQKMEAIGQLAGGVAHDFNNLLTVITGYSELLMHEISDEKVRGDAEQIQKAGQRAASLTRQLLAFSRRQVLQPKILDLNAVVTDIEKLLRRLIGEDIDLTTSLEPSLGRIKADPGQIEQVIVNLAVNARDAMINGGALTIQTSNVDLSELYTRQRLGVEPGHYVLLAVSDTGVGMSAEIQARIFEPFFTTKEQDKGTGLGLATVYGIVTQSEGTIDVYSKPGQGTTFKIYLPRIAEVRPTINADDDQPAVAPGGSETILLVEDEGGVRELAREILQRNGYCVLEAGNGQEALQITGQLEQPIHLLLTDVVMPRMSGRELAEQLSPLHPEMKVLFMSGYTDKAVVHQGVLDPQTDFLQKPFTPDALARKLRTVLDN